MNIQNTQTKYRAPTTQHPHQIKASYPHPYKKLNQPLISQTANLASISNLSGILHLMTDAYAKQRLSRIHTLADYSLRQLLTILMSPLSYTTKSFWSSPRQKEDIDTVWSLLARIRIPPQTPRDPHHSRDAINAQDEESTPLPSSQQSRSHPSRLTWIQYIPIPTLYATTSLSYSTRVYRCAAHTLTRT